MTEVNYLLVMLDLVPGASLRIEQPFGDYYSIVWMDDRPMPSKAECDAAWPRVSALNVNADAEQARRLAFRDEADPLYFGWRRGENSEQDWLDKVQEIRDRHPYVEVPE